MAFPLGLVITVLAAFVAISSSASGASAPVTVAITVPSAITLGNSCTAAASYRFGTVLPNSPALTSTTVPCSMSFTSSNDSAMLRVGQKDGGLGVNAMGMASTAFTTNVIDDDHLQDVDQTDLNNGWAVGYNAVMLQTTDGTTWTDRSPTFAGILGGTWMTSVDIVNGSPGTAFAGGGKNLVRIDSANTAAPVAVDLTARLGWPNGATVLGVLAVTTSEVIVVGSGGRVARSTNANLAAGSVTFANYTVGSTASDFYDIAKAAANTYYIVGDTDVYKTVNGSTNNLASDWTAQGAGFGQTIAAGSATALYAGGWDGELLTSTGGAWTNRSTPARSMATYRGSTTGGAGFPNVAWVTGVNGELFKTTDTGVNWTRQVLPTSNYMRGLSAVNDQVLVAVGADRLIMRSIDGGTTWTKQNYDGSGLSQLNAVDVDPSNGLVAVAVGSSAGVGSPAYVRRTTNGGGAWSTVVPPTSNALFGVSFGTSLVAWAVGEGGTILKSSDAGASWTAQSSPTTLRLRAVHARNDAEAWAVGEQGVVVATTNGGASWNIVNAGTTTALNDVLVTNAGGPPGTVVAAGNNGLIKRTTDGGATWTTPTSPIGGGQVVGIAAATDTTLWIADTGHNDLWRSVDAGATWIALGQPAGDDPQAIAAVGDAVVDAGAWGLAARSSDGGASWAAMSPASNNTQYGLAMADAHTTYAVGEGGTVRTTVPQGGATALVSNYAFNTSDWDTAGTTSMFGMCLQNVGGATTVAPGWTKDITNTSGKCEGLDTDPWAAVPAAQTKLAYTAGPGVSGQVDVVWGVRPAATQAPGTYMAAVVFEALAPNV